MDEDISLRINKCRTYIGFMLSQQQWSGITKIEVENWLSNFKDLTPNENLLVYKLLTSLIYYSEKDIINALKEGINSRLFYNILLDQQIKSDFELSPQAIHSMINEELQKTCFIPLLDNDSPHESANYVTRLLVQQGIVEPQQSMFINSIVEPIQAKKFTRLVIVDDCIGSGDQLKKFWNITAKVDIGDKKMSLREFCKQEGVETKYIVLFGYDNSIIQLQKEMIDLEICCVRMLTDTQRVFAESSYVWEDEEERQQAIVLFRELTSAHGIPLLGYCDLDFAFVMHQTIPDWSLPLFWKENPDWKLLIRRKNSNA